MMPYVSASLAAIHIFYANLFMVFPGHMGERKDDSLGKRFPCCRNTVFLLFHDIVDVDINQQTSTKASVAKETVLLWSLGSAWPEPVCVRGVVLSLICFDVAVD